MSGAGHESFTRFGELLRYLRLRAQISQRALGHAVGYTGAHITRLEKGKRRPDPLVVRARFLDALDLGNEPDLAQRLISLAAAEDHGLPDTSQQLVEPKAPAAEQRRTNLPAQLTSFIGREREMEKVTRLIGSDGTRLLTLTGAGGCGKTRLAIEVGLSFARVKHGRHLRGMASPLLPFPDGAWLVDLAPLSDPAGVSRAVKDALGLPDELGRTLTDVLIEYLEARRVLLLLDNCEHLIIRLRRTGRVAAVSLSRPAHPGH